MRVRIYQPAKTAMQSGRGKTGYWLIEPELLTARTPESIMGWASAGDTYTELLNKLKFPAQEEAIQFAQKKGWTYEVTEAGIRRVTPRNYLDNFRITRPQDEERKNRN